MSQAFIQNVMADGRFERLYAQTAQGEKETRELLIQFEQDYPGVTKEANVNEIAENLQKKTSRASVLAQLRERRPEPKQQEPAKKPKTRNDPER